MRVVITHRHWVHRLGLLLGNFLRDPGLSSLGERDHDVAALRGVLQREQGGREVGTQGVNGAVAVRFDVHAVAEVLLGRERGVKSLVFYGKDEAQNTMWP